MSAASLSPGLRDFLVLLALVSFASLVAAGVMVALLWRRLRRLRTTGRGFWQTLREVPLGLVVLLDLLDLGLDVFAAPVIWFLLRRLNLTALSEVATIEALIPISAPVPTMTLCWLAARVRRRDGAPLLGAGAGGGPVLEGEQVAPGRWKAGP